MDRPRHQGTHPGIWLGAAFFAAAHVLLARELFCAGRGAETAVAACAGASLAWAALGTALAARLWPRPGTVRETLLLLLLPPAAAAQLWAARAPVVLAARLSGGALSPATMGLAAIVLTAPAALIFGLLLPGLDAGGNGGARGWSRLGSALAAGPAAVALAGLFGLELPLTAALLCAAYSCLLSAVQSPVLFRRGKMLLALWAAAVSAGGIAFAALPLGRAWLLDSSARGGLVTAPGRAVARIETPRGPLVLARGEAHGFGLILNGRPLTQYPDPAARTDAIFACAQAPSLDRVLVLGGGRPELVRELLARGAGRVEVLSAGPGPDELLAGHLPGPEIEALRSDRVERRHGNLRGLLRAPGGRCSLILMSPPEPSSADSAALYSREFLADLAGRLAQRGVLVLCLPSSAGPSQWQARVYATLRELGDERLPDGTRLLGRPDAFPADRLRLAAARSASLCETPEKCLTRYRTHRMPDGSMPVPVGIEDLARLVDVLAARAATERLLELSGSAQAIRETGLTPGIMLDCVSEQLAGRSPASAAALSTVRRLPLPVPYVAAWLGLVVTWLLARRGAPAAPGRLVLGTGAFVAGLVPAAGIDLCCSLYSSATGSLWGALPLVVAAFAAGLGAAAALGLRLLPLAERSPRRTLAVVQFVGLLLLLLGIQLTGLDPAGPWADLVCGLALVLIGAMAGCELTLLTGLYGNLGGPGRPLAATAFWAGVGATTAATLAVSLLLAALGPAPTILLLISLKIAMLGLLTAGIGRRRGAQQQYSPAETPAQ